MRAKRRWPAYVAAVILAAFCPVWAQRSDQKREARLKKELASGWERWMREDVAWIITDEERKAFGQLGTDEEREQFVEQFWLRRDPTPDTVENEYKEEHYRRIAYANEHFASGIPGWRTDRGRIYIRFGPPDEIDSHPSGGSWERPAAEGGGTTSTYPFEQWRYRHLAAIGEDIIVEFVDTTMSGEYRMTIDPCEKDALTNVPGAGPTMAEQLGLSTRLARFQNTDGTHCGAPLGARPESYNPFTRLELEAKLDKPPGIKFRDLEAAVSSRVTYNVLPMRVRVDYLRVTDFSVLTNVTLQFETRDLQFQSKDGLEKAVVKLAGRIYTLSRRPVTMFEHALEIADSRTAAQKSLYQESVPLAPGRYKLEILAKDTASGSMTRYEAALDVPRYDDEKLDTSSLILADAIERLPAKSAGAGMFSIGDTKVRPRIDRQFAQSETMGIYMQVYNLGHGDDAGGRITYQIEKAGTKEKVFEFSEDLSAAHGPVNQAAIEKLLPLRTLGPGDYTLKLQVAEGNLAVEREANFTVHP